MHLVDTKVRRDWHEITEQLAAEHARLWRMIQGVVLVALLTVILVTALATPEPYRTYVYWLAPFGLYMLVVVWFIARSAEERLSRFRVVALYGGMVVLVGAALAVWPVVGPSQLVAGDRNLWPVPLWAVSVLAVGNWLVIWWARRSRPGALQHLRLSSQQPMLDLVIGGGVGAAFGFHFMITLNFRQAVSWPVVLWAVVYLVGVRSLSEELLFRGLGYHVLFERLDQSLAGTVVRVAAWSTLPLAILLLGSRDLIPGLWILAYSVALSVLATYLRNRRQSTIPGLAASFVFGLFAITVVMLGGVL